MAKNKVKDDKAAASKNAAVAEAIAQITKKHGSGSIIMGQQIVRDVPVISTGALPVDIALGVGGIPKGRITEIFGPESSGKTTLALQVVANAQRTGGVAAYIDAEHALDPTYAANLGVNMDKILLSQPDYGEQALDIVEALVNSSVVDVIIVDSVAALTPKAELDGNIGDAFVGLHARMMAQAMRKLSGLVHRNNCALVFINQLREKIGGVSWGSNETTTGGRALKFYASCRIDIRRIGGIKAGGGAADSDASNIGNRIKVKIAKNKVAPPFKIAEFDIIFGKGVSHAGCLLDYAEKFNIFKKSGSFFIYNEERLANGRQNMVTLLETNKTLAAEIEALVLELAQPKVDDQSPAVEEEAPTEEEAADQAESPVETDAPAE